METLDPGDLTQLYGLSDAEVVGLDLHAFSAGLWVIGERFLHCKSAYAEVLAFYRSLHLKDLALAQACHGGSPVAWRVFLDRFRDYLYATAMSISRNEQTARDLSDSLIGELYGGSKLNSYSGRGSMEGWLRAVLSHTYIDQYRSDRRTLTLEGQVDLLESICFEQSAGRIEPHERLELAIQEAFGHADFCRTLRFVGVLF